MLDALLLRALTAMLWLWAAPHVRDAIAGDLLEEHAALQRQRDSRYARRWLASQILRSVAPLALQRARALPLPFMFASALATAALPLYALDQLWSHVLSAIPLRAAVERDWHLASGCVMVGLISGLMMGTLNLSRPRAERSWIASICIACGAALLAAWPLSAIYPALFVPLFAATHACGVLLVACAVHCINHTQTQSEGREP